MAIRLRVVAIIPKHRVIDVTSFVKDIDRELAVNFAGAVIRDMSAYPPVLPWAHGFPQSGPRKGGRRTGRYGRGWRLRGHRRGTLVEVTDPVTYAVFVGGPTTGIRGQRQARFQGRRGWPSITTVIDRRWPPTQRAIVRIIAGTARSRRPLRLR